MDYSYVHYTILIKFILHLNVILFTRCIFSILVIYFISFSIPIFSFKENYVIDIIQLYVFDFLILLLNNKWMLYYHEELPVKAFNLIVIFNAYYYYT